MKHSTGLFLAVAALTGVFASPLAQANTLDVVRDQRGGFVCTAEGDCVRTKWKNDSDICAGEAQGMVQKGKVYFGLGSSVLTAESKKTLDAMIGDVKKAGPSVRGVRISGFADRIGNAVKNEKLSKKRADAVRAYLAAKGVTGAQILETKWFGDSTSSAICPQKLKKAALVKCLQSDRRVEIDVEYALTK